MNKYLLTFYNVTEDLQDELDLFLNIINSIDLIKMPNLRLFGSNVDPILIQKQLKKVNDEFLNENSYLFLTPLPQDGSNVYFTYTEDLIKSAEITKLSDKTIDDILDKINSFGLDSLTKEERLILDSL